MNNWIVRRYANLARPEQVERITDFGLCVVGDKKAHTWRVVCVYNDEPADLTGYSAQGYFIRADKQTVVVDASVAGNVVDCVLDQSCYAIEGTLMGVLKIENTTSGEIVTIGAMLIRLTQGSTDVIIDPGEAIPSLSDLLAEIDAMRTATANANSATSSANSAAASANTAATNAGTAATNANTARTNAITATTAANNAAAAANQAAADALANFGGLSFAVNPDDGGLDITYTY